MKRENDLILPLLARDEGISLSHLLEEMHEGLTAATPETTPGQQPSSHHHHGCGCYEVDEEVPELDARLVPHAIRHATIFAALDAVPSGRRMVLVAPHDPLPLLAQIEQRDPGAFAVEYLQRGPEAWCLQFVRTG